MAFQSKAQADAIYGRDRAEVLRDNCDTQIFYRPANLSTAEFLERRLGRKSGWAQSKTTHDGTETSQGSSEYGIPLMTAQEIMQMGDEEIIAFHSNLPPIRAKRIGHISLFAMSFVSSALAQMLSGENSIIYGSNNVL